MYQSIILYAIVALNTVLAFIALARNSKSRANRVFALMVVIISAWMLASYYEDAARTLSVAKFFLHADFMLAPIMGFLMLVFVVSLFDGAKKPISKRALSVLGAIALITSAFTLMPLFDISSAIISSAGISYTDNIWTFVYYLVVLVFIVTIAVTVQKASKLARGRTYAQIRLVSFGMILWGSLALIANTLLVQLSGNPSTSRLGIYAATIYIGLTAYAIIRHKLFDIRAVVARSITYILSIVTISVTYGIVAFTLVGGAVFNNTKLPLIQQAFYAILAVILAFTFQPIRRFFQRVTDKIFYRDKYDPQELINAVGRILTAEIRLNVLTKEVTNVISKQMRVNKVDIVVVNDKNIYYQARVLRSDRSELELKDLQELGKPMLVADDMSTGDRKDIMDKYGLRVSITLRTSEEFVGYLLLGEKLSGDIYNEQDLAVLRIIANELAVAVQNAKAYTEIQQFNKTLQAKVVAATHKLRKANEDLKELDQAKDEFISMASHQLRTPLTTAKGYVSMVLEGDFGKINPAMKEPLTQSLDSANRMAGLVSDLLNVSRMEAGRFFIDTTDVDLNVEVPAEVSQLQTMADSKSVKLVYTKPAKPVPMMKLDLDKTRQVIMNLVDNAIHYSAPPNGGGKVEVSLAQEGVNIVFKVVDNGIGVPLAQQKKLFKKFFRAANAQNTRPDGTGLGLYLVKRVVEDQGGEVVFESKEGKGSTFGFSIPVHNKIKPNSKAAQKLAGAETQLSPNTSKPVATKAKKA